MRKFKTPFCYVNQKFQLLKGSSDKESDDISIQFKVYELFIFKKKSFYSFFNDNSILTTEGRRKGLER